MKSLPDSYYSHNIMVCYMVIMPIYTLFFIIGLKPFQIEALFHISTIGPLAFRASIMMAIEFVIILISRICMLILKDKLKLTYSQYYFWEVVEYLVIVMFWSLFVWLISNRVDPYFSIVPTLFIFSFSILIFPYIVFYLMAENNSKDLRLEEVTELLDKYSSGQIGAEKSPVHFMDDKGHLKLLVTANAILYVEAADNYVNIHYINNGKMVRYSLRNTMKGIENVCLENCLARCHRSYFINLQRVRILKREKDGLYAELEYEGAPHIPVSKTCADQVIKRFSAFNG